MATIEKKTTGEIASMYRAIDELQPQNAQQVLSDYDLGTKAAYAINRTADLIEGWIKPLRKAEQQYQVKLQKLTPDTEELEKQVRQEKDPDKKSALRLKIRDTREAALAKHEKEIKELQESFEKDRQDILDEEVADVQVHSLDLASISDKCRPFAWWVFDALKDMWTYPEADQHTYTLSLDDALKVHRGVQVYLSAPPSWALDEKSQDKRFPVDIGWPFARKLYWNALSIQKAIEPFLDEQDAKIKMIEEEDSGRKGKKSKKSEDPGDTKETITREQFEAWQDEQLAKTLEIKGVQAIKMSEFPEGKGTPSGAVIRNLSPILEED